MKDAKYLLAYIAPISAFFAVYYAGPWSFATVIIAFGIIPSLEFFTPNSQENFNQEEESDRLASRFFDLLLYLNLPMLFLLVVFYLSQITTNTYTTIEVVGMTMSVGIIVGALGINVAHELGHRSTWYEQLMSKSMLLTALYMHFFIEHNRGHHKNVATDLDPASAKRGQSLYAFWFSSTLFGYLNAWKIEAKRLAQEQQSFWSVHNEMLVFQIIQIAYLALITYFFGLSGLFFAIAIAIIGFLQLETVNYIEHYGLRRKKLENGRYEMVSPKHSWNSNHEVGRIFLYELTRHSDHHFKASRKYQILRHMDDSPQLPLGYPGSMLLSLIPPLWFNYMDKQLEAHLSK